jgi:hypothetical protein
LNRGYWSLGISRHRRAFSAFATKFKVFTPFRWPLKLSAL